MGLNPNISKFGKLIGIAALVGGVVFYGTRPGHFMSMDSIKAVFQKKVDLPSVAPLKNVTNVPLLPLPSKNVIGTGPSYRVEVAPWSAQNGAFLANGGPVTTEGSILAGLGITNLKFIRQDSFKQQSDDLIAYMKEWKSMGGGKANPNKGCQFISLMGDGSSSYLRAIVAELTSAGFHPQIKVALGKSANEDGFWGPKEWKDKPSSMKGGVVIGVLYDGDMNLPLKYCPDNDVQMNPNIKTYDPDRMNIIPAQDDDFLKAVDQYNVGVTEEREISHNGILTGKKIKITTDKSKSSTTSFTIASTIGGTLYVEAGVVTYTPGDVRITKGKGGLFPIVTTYDYYWQMPDFLVTTKEWADANHNEVKSIIKGFLLGGSQVKVHDKALFRACEIACDLYKGTGEEGTPKFWYTNFKKHEVSSPDGSVDKEGKPTGKTIQVNVGGSMNFSIEDNIVAFGLEKGDGGPAQSTYTVFADKMVELWPDKMKDYPAFQDVFDPSFLNEITKETTLNQELTMKPDVDGAPIRETISTSNKSIQFISGRSELTAEGRKECKKLFNDENITGLKLLITGHTDRHGSHETNMKLSKDRAETVKRFLANLGYKEDLIDTDAKGDTELLDPANNSTADAKNRRVVIQMGR